MSPSLRLRASRLPWCAIALVAVALVPAEVRAQPSALRAGVPADTALQASPPLAAPAGLLTVPARMTWAALEDFESTQEPADSSAAFAQVPPDSSGRRDWVRADRLQHGSLAFAIGIGAGVLTDEPAAAFGAAAALGLLKEILDRGHTGFDAVDLWADLIGAGLAALAVHALDR